MSTQMIITLIITLIMAIFFLTAKFPFGLVTMSCAVALVLTGVLSISDAFAGMANQTVILVASMFAMSAALQKTSLPYYMKGLLGAINGKSDLALVAVMVAVFLILEIVLPGMVCMVLVVSVLQMLPEDSEVTPSRIILPLLMLNVCWEMAVPVGLGATMDFTANLYMEGLLTDSTQVFSMGNLFMIRIIPTIVTVAYVLFIWKRMPKRELNLEGVKTQELAKSALPRWKEIVIYAMFVGIILSMVFSSFFGSLMFIIPAACVCVLGFIGVLSTKEIVGSVASDTVWMLVGILAVTAALTNSGAAELVGNLLLPLISWTTNPYLICVIVCAFTAIMTTFLSNTGSQAVLSPLVTSMAVAAGMDPRTLVACVFISGTFAFCFPSGSTTCAFAYGLGQYNPLKVLKYTVPLLLILVLVTAASANLFFPLFG